MALYTTKVNFQGKLYSVNRSSFQDGSLAVLLVEDSGEVFHIASTEHTQQVILREDETVLVDYAEVDDMMWLLTLASIALFTGRRAPGTNFPICRLIAKLPTTELYERP